VNLRGERHELSGHEVEPFAVLSLEHKMAQPGRDLYALDQFCLHTEERARSSSASTIAG
jgi:hypothetical protein